MPKDWQELTVVFETITPLWTGDAWMQNASIRPSSILGSLRFWFEVMCLAGLVENCKIDRMINEYRKNKDFRLMEDFKLRDDDKKNILKGSTTIYEIAHKNLSLPSYIFGATGWKGLVRVKEIYYDSKNFITVENTSLQKGNKRKWYRGEKEYVGEFTIGFEIYSEYEDLFWQLLLFVEKYGFLGGKWNIGYGRVAIKNKPNSQLRYNFDTKTLTSDKNHKVLATIIDENSFYCKEEKEFSSKTKKNFPFFAILFDTEYYRDNNFLELIKKLLINKKFLRDCLRPKNEDKNWKDFRHSLLGTAPNNTQGSKILPWITKTQDGKYQGGFISLAGLLNLKSEKK